MNKETLVKLIADYDGELDTLGTHIWLQTQTEQRIKADIRALRNSVETAKQAYEAVSRDACKKLAEIQSECPHLETTFHSDPSGGNGSYTECDWCGAEMPKSSIMTTPKKS